MTNPSSSGAVPARSWAGLSLERPRVMGILNVTPDSFSDGGRHSDLARAVRAGLAMAQAGADIIDVGGESTRPGAYPISPSLEQARVIPVIRELASAGLRVSVDTRNAATMRAALDAGATVVNDISALAHDPEAPPLVASRGCPVVLMHMRGTPQTMSSAARYADVIAEVRRELAERVEAALLAGTAPEQICLDPGIGFAKAGKQNEALLRGLGTLAELGFPLLVGVSRKRFIGRLTAIELPSGRLAGSLAAGLFALSHGASILRVHDVPETVQAIRVWHALASA
ncbi:MAG: dihydropteroate synthase [Acetobacteraceae bacterium]|nr:dihydropteroate synthase [Acetobacteraceae bacterium]MBV8520524.1 dihydropteroate synthase [Acetobacteraceae bacterium]